MQTNKYQESFITDNSRHRMILSDRQGGKTSAILLDIEDKIREAKKERLNRKFCIYYSRERMAKDFGSKLQRFVDIGKHAVHSGVKNYSKVVFYTEDSRSSAPDDIHVYIDNLNFFDADDSDLIEGHERADRIAVTADLGDNEEVEHLLQNDHFSVTMMPAVDKVLREQA